MAHQGTIDIGVGRDVEFGDDVEPAVAKVWRDVLGDTSDARVIHVGVVPIASVAKLGGLVVERQHLELLGLLPPHLDQLAQLVGILGRHVGCLRHVVGNVVQLPMI